MAAFFGDAERLPDDGAHAEHVEIAAGDEGEGNLFGLTPGLRPDHFDVEGAIGRGEHRLEEAAAITQAFEEWIGEILQVSSRVDGVEQHEPVRLADRQPLHQHRVDEREDRRRAADAERQRQHRDQRDARVAPESARRVSHVLAPARGTRMPLAS